MKNYFAKPYILGIIGFVGLAPSAFGSGYTSTTGSVTPSELTVTFTSVNLISDSNQYSQVISGTFPVVFKRTDSDMTAVSFGSINVPAGRYIGVSLGMNFTYSVKLNGDRYRGTTTGSISSGTQLYSVGSDARAANSISTSGTATTMTNLLATGTTNSTSGTTQSYFGTPICVASDSSSTGTVTGSSSTTAGTSSGGTVCKSGDKVLGTGNAPLPNLYVMMDLYNSVAVDASNMALAINNTYPVPMLGQPGAAIHLQNSNGAEWMAIFGSDKSLLATRGFWSSSSTNGAPTGGNYVTATAAPSGQSINSYGPTTISSYDATSDVLKTPMGDCPGSTCTSSGLLTLTGTATTNAGSTITASCSSDATGALGYSYTGANCFGHGQAVTVPTYTVVRIVDPNNLFGHCSSSSPGYVTGSGTTGGTCVTSSASGFPGNYY